MVNEGAVRRYGLAILLAAALAVGLAGQAAADPITDDNVAAMVAAAKTPADHQALATFFKSKADEAKAMVQMHKTMGGAFSGKQKENWGMHCRSLVATYKKQVKEYEALAKQQEALAK